METKKYSKIEKVVVNAGIGRISALPNFKDKILPQLISDFALLAGQKPAPRPAKKSISGFKLREGAIVGLAATLRGAHMRHFIERLTKIVLPRLRDFRGIDPHHIDANGNLTIGIKENIVFPEIAAEANKVSFGVSITFVPVRVVRGEEAMAMYRGIGIPFQKSAKKKH